MRNRSPIEAAPETCRLCPRRCGVDRRHRVGFCGAGDRARVYTHGPHHGEEPPISGSRGSGTVFFSHCTLRCWYCQNYPWSQEGQGAVIGVPGLVDAMASLVEQGCHNWNLVSPTPWLAEIVAALRTLRTRQLRLPVVYNTSGYETPETLAAMAPWVDVYLTDMRYADAATAREASGAADYVGVARRALCDMWLQKGALRVDDDGVATRGVICRILVLPGRAAEAIESLQWIAEMIGTGIPVSVMSQYTPAWRASEIPGWNRSLAQDDYEPVRQAVTDLGFDTGWVQDLEQQTPPPLIGYNMRAADPAVSAAV